MGEETKKPGLKEEFGYIVRVSGRGRPAECIYILEQKDEQGDTLRKQFFNFAVRKVKTVIYENGAWASAQTHKFSEYEDKEALQETWNAFRLRHEKWLMPGTIAPLKLN